MSLFRCLGVAFLTLAATGTLHAQTASFSALGLTALFGQETPSQETPSQETPGEETQEAEELPAPQRAEISLLPAFVPECLLCWKEQWKLGHYREAELLATIACRWDPTNITAQHALALSEIMVGLTANSETETSCCEGLNICPLVEKLARSVVGAQCQMGNVVFTRTATNDKSCSACSASKTCCEEAGCCAAKTAVGCSAQEAQTCAGCAKTNTAANNSDCKVKVINFQPALFGQGFNSDFQGGLNPAFNHAVTLCSDLSVPSKTGNSACACEKDCGCCKPTAQNKKNTSVMMLPSPSIVFHDFSVATPPCPFLEELANIWSAPMPTARSVTGTVVAVTPPGCSVNPVPFFQFPPPGMTMPSPEFFNGMPPGLPSPVQAMQDLERIRNAVINKSRANVQFVEVSSQSAARQKAHIVTPYFEAHCERMTSSTNPDNIVLEGDVYLTSNRSGQSVRIHAQKVTVHLADGSFTVESNPILPQPAPARRVSTQVETNFQPATYVAPVVQWEMVRPVRAVNDTPDHEHFKPEE